jgi:hypothetical protein
MLNTERKSTKTAHLTVTTHVDLDGLALGVVGQSSLAQLSSNTRLLESTEGKSSRQHVVTVDPHSSGLQAGRHIQGSVEVLGVDSGGKTVGGGVANLDDLVGVLELSNGGNGSEDFLDDCKY